MVKAKIPYGMYPKDFREDAARLVPGGGLSAAKAADRLSMPKSALERWIKVAKQYKLDEIGKSQRPLSEQEFELAHVKRELEILKIQRDILKKAAVYSAKESLQGTR
ncbi:MAG: transposase [Desulfomonilaceae bacterium]